MQPHSDAQLERYAWVALLACVVVVPLAVSKLPFSDVPLTFDAFGFPQNVLLAIGVSIALLLWGAALVAKQANLSLSPPMIAFGAFATWAAVATVAAYEPARSLFGRSVSSLSLVNIAACCAVFFLATQLVHSRQRMGALTWAVVASASAVGLIALFQQLFGANVFGLTSIEDWLTGRGFSTIGNPDHLGTFLVLPLLLSGLLFLFEEDGRARLAAGVCVALLVTVLTGTLTRGAWIAAATGALVTVPLLLRARLTPAQRKRALVLLGICAAAIALALLASDHTELATRFKASPSGSQTASTTLAAVNAASSDRINVWRSSFRIVGERPLTGTGPAAFELGWYPNAIDPSSSGGEGGLADDPHSFVIYVLATTGIPGLLAYLVACGWALVLGARTSFTLTKDGPPSGKALYYVAWFVAACALQVALLVGAVSTPIVMYTFLSFAVLLRPTVHAVDAGSSASAGRMLAAGASVALAVALSASVSPSLSAELALASALRGNPLEQASAAVRAVPWNLDIQKAYFHLKVAEVNRALAVGTSSARDDVAGVVDDLAKAGAKQPREFYYPSVRAQVLTEASNRLGHTAYAEAAIQAADDALAIMPASIPTRVNKALALSDLERYGEMAETLSGYWANESGSAYPGILYAQALALSGKTQAAEATFSALLSRFPAESGSIRDAQSQVEQLRGRK